MERTEALAGGSFAQTLSRGIRVLEVLAEHGAPMSANELAGELGLHRSVVYRCARTLAEHRLVSTQPDGRYALGLKLVTLARGVEPDVRAIAFPVLQELSDGVGATALYWVADGFEAVCLLSVEPRHSTVHLVHRQGIRHPLDRGSSGLAILAGRPPSPGERQAVADARQRGWSSSRGELERSAAAVAAPVLVPGRAAEASVAVVFLQDALREDDVAPQVVRAAARIADRLG